MKKLYLFLILSFYCSPCLAEDCKWWFNRFGWKNFTVLEVENCLKTGSSVVSDTPGGNTPLHIAAETINDPEIILRLLRAGAEINATNKDGWTPLHSAARFNANPSILFVMIDNGADIKAKTNIGKTALFWMEKNLLLRETDGYLKLLNLNYD
tara:strand:- start:29 stop:487 length:459 start_codon:yes stop_codon:yes gene_type:complete